MQIFELPGVNIGAGAVHSLHAGNIQVDNDLNVGGEFKASSVTIGINGIMSQGPVAIASGQQLKLGNVYTAGALTATGTLTIVDANGTVYRIPCAI